LNDQRYFISFIDYHFRFVYLYFLSNKVKAFDVFNTYKAEVEKQKEKITTIIRSDRGEKYYSKYIYIKKEYMPCPFAKFLEWKGIIAQYKAGAFDAFKIYKVEAEKQKKNINIVSLDKDREYYGR
jgi:hypothetical protein